MEGVGCCVGRSKYFSTVYSVYGVYSVYIGQWGY